MRYKKYNKQYKQNYLPPPCIKCKTCVTSSLDAATPEASHAA